MFDLCLSVFIIHPSGYEVQSHSTFDLYYPSPMDVEHIFMWFLAIYISYFEKCQFKSLLIFELSCLLLSCFYIFQINPLPYICLSSILSYSIASFSLSWYCHLILMKSSSFILIFFFHCLLFWCFNQKTVVQYYKVLLLCFLLNNYSLIS